MTWRFLFLFAAGGLALAFALAFIGRNDRAAKIAAAPDPAALVNLIVDEPGAHAAVTVAPPRLAVSLDLARWDSNNDGMKSTFDMIAAQLVPAVFSRFPAIDSIEIVGNAPFRDIRGNDSSRTALRIAFSRGNAATVQWNNVVFIDVPKFADSYWSDPALRE
jgi:hypothetical protein